MLKLETVIKIKIITNKSTNTEINKEIKLRVNTTFLYRLPNETAYFLKFLNIFNFKK